MHPSGLLSLCSDRIYSLPWQPGPLSPKTPSGSLDLPLPQETLWAQRGSALARGPPCTTTAISLLPTPDSPPTSIFFRFLASRTMTVSFPAVGT